MRRSIIGMTISPEVLEKIDLLRGNMSRSRFIEGILKAELTKENKLQEADSDDVSRGLAAD